MSHQTDVLAFTYCAPAPPPAAISEKYNHGGFDIDKLVGDMENDVLVSMLCFALCIPVCVFVARLLYKVVCGTFNGVDGKFTGVFDSVFAFILSIVILKSINYFFNSDKSHRMVTFHVTRSRSRREKTEVTVTLIAEVRVKLA